jgi:transposase InsO family protein
MALRTGGAAGWQRADGVACKRMLLREDTVPAAASVLAQQERFAAWRADYNSCRPHEALGQRYPASL